MFFGYSNTIAVGVTLSLLSQRSDLRKNKHLPIILIQMVKGVGHNKNKKVQILMYGFKTYLFKVWHSSILCFGIEMCIIQGQMVVFPCNVFSVKYRMKPSRTLSMGKTTKSKKQLLHFLDAVRKSYVTKTYHLLRNNCNHFSNHVLNFLTGKTLPIFIQRPLVCCSNPEQVVLALLSFRAFFKFWVISTIVHALHDALGKKHKNYGDRKII